MITSLMKALINLIMAIFATIANIILLPIETLAMTVFPDLQDYMQTVETFFFDTCFKYIGFVKEVIINITGLDRSLFYTIITLLFARITFKYSTMAIKFIINIWRTYKGSGGEMVE